jgi:hypothetical protein
MLFNGAYDIVEKPVRMIWLGRASVDGRIILKWILKK